MGYRFHKHVDLGPFRINFSKSGIGTSFGTKGFRIAKTAKGTTRITSSIPGTGISHVSETSRTKRAQPQKRSSGCLAKIFWAFVILMILGAIAGRT